MDKTTGQVVSVADVFPPSFKSSGIHRLLIPLLFIAILPLAYFSMHVETSFADKLIHTIQAHPEDPGLRQRISDAQDKKLSDDQIFLLLPDHRLTDALLPHDTNMHWLIAPGAAMAFLIVIFLAIPRTTRLRTLLFVAAFTATIGMLVLFVFQAAAASATENDAVTLNCFYELFYILMKLIGYSYAAANNPESGFILSFIGFTFSVGLCEEIVKAFPLLLIAQKNGEKNLSCKKLLLWGLVSGVGFGAAEGMQYASFLYNGVSGADDYIIRFASCVALHGVWSGIFAMILCNRLLWLRHTRRWWNYCFEVMLIALVPMVLHGLYDTLLKEHHDLLAFLAALFSTLFLSYLIRVMNPEVVPPEPVPDAAGPTGQTAASTSSTASVTTPPS